MRRMLCSLLICSASAVLGQSQPQNAATVFVPPATLHLLKPYGMDCPAAMTANRQASGQQEWVVSLEDKLRSGRPDTKANAAGVRVELAGLTSKPMKQAELVVYYLAPGVHVLPAAQSVEAAAHELTKTFVLSTAAGGSDSRLAGSLLVGNAASVTRVRLRNIEYVDGSRWQTKSANSCTVEPGLLMTLGG